MAQTWALPVFLCLHPIPFFQFSESPGQALSTPEAGSDSDSQLSHADTLFTCHLVYQEEQHRRRWTAQVPTGASPPQTTRQKDRGKSPNLSELQQQHGTLYQPSLGVLLK